MAHALAHLLTAWNEPDEDGRAEILDAALADDFTYIDPHQPKTIDSRDGLLDFLDIFRTNVTGAVVLVRGDVQRHHGHAMVRIEIQRRGNPFAHMLYVADEADDGRLTRVVGFMDEA